MDLHLEGREGMLREDSLLKSVALCTKNGYEVGGAICVGLTGDVAVTMPI
jgi:hypothetical protein